MHCRMQCFGVQPVRNVQCSVVQCVVMQIAVYVMQYAVYVMQYAVHSAECNRLGVCTVHCNANCSVLYVVNSIADTATG